MCAKCLGDHPLPGTEEHCTSAGSSYFCEQRLDNRALLVYSFCRPLLPNLRTNQLETILAILFSYKIPSLFLLSVWKSTDSHFSVMKTADILQTFHSMPASDRLDIICRMLRHCVPFELRFLGTIVCDTAREQYKSFVKAELSANRVNYFSGFKDTGLTHEVCEKLCCALPVVHADNHPVAETVFSLLNDLRVLSFFEDTTDMKVLEDFRLLYVMAVNHPALSFNQRQHLMYTYLHRMDSVFSEKCKYNFSGSFSSMEVSTMLYRAFSCDVITFVITKENRKQLPCWCTTR